MTYLLAGAAAVLHHQHHFCDGTQLLETTSVLQAISLMSTHGGTVECHCLMQVIRGAETCALPYGDDIHNALRQYRAQCSTTSKPAPEIPGTDGESHICSLMVCRQVCSHW